MPSIPNLLNVNLKHIKLLGLTAVLFIVSACANRALKETCENTNWFTYSQNVSFQGKYLEEDALIQSCKKLDLISSEKIDVGFKLGREKFCNYDEIYNRGREGVPVYFQFCDGLNLGSMKSAYTKGLAVFCTASNGTLYGLSGKVYQKVCPMDSEKSFMLTYIEGRKTFLKNSIAKLKNENSDYLAREKTLQQSEYHFTRQIITLPNTVTCHERTQFDASGLVKDTFRNCDETDQIKDLRFNLNSQLNYLRRDLSELRSMIERNYHQLQLAESELITLGSVRN